MITISRVDPLLAAGFVNNKAACRLLGINPEVPVTHATMASSLRVTFFPWSHPSSRVADFARQLESALTSSGVEIVPWDSAVAGGRRGKIGEGIIIIAPGRLDDGKLPVDFVPNLRSNTVVGIEDGPCPAESKSDQQDKLNTIVETLTWNIVQVVIYVNESSWTICTMNGAIIPCHGGGTKFQEDVYQTLVPKLAAPVVPPHASDFHVEEGGLDLRAQEWEKYVRDFERSSPLWAETGLMLFHTSLSDLEFRNTYYRRVAAAYLDRRSGMSYGFLSRQPSSVVRPAMNQEEARTLPEWDALQAEGFGEIDGDAHVVIRMGGALYVVRIPTVSVLATRSGCDKSHLDGYRDLVLLGMSRGSVFMKTPKGLAAGIDARPSYDTLTILAHAVANEIIASVLKRVQPVAPYLRNFERDGIALAHWHGDLDKNVIPRGYAVFGENNPPVSCSTHQAALYTLTGKLEAFALSMKTSGTYVGDVHIEPHHGINVTWPTLTGLASTILTHATASNAKSRCVSA